MTAHSFARLRTLIFALIAVVCLTGLWLGYTWFEGRYVRAFSDQAVLFSGETLRLPPMLAGPGRIRVVHFWDPACPCNVGNQQHLSELVERFSGAGGVDFYVVQKPRTQGQWPTTLSSIKIISELPGAERVTSSPAVAIWDRQGNLAYFGPYSEGLVCNAQNSFIEPILQALKADRPVDATHTLAVGCYCPWSRSHEPF